MSVDLEVRSMFPGLEEADQERFMVLKYLYLRDPVLRRSGEKMTMLEVANQFGVSRTKLYYMIQAWEEAGLLKSARQDLLTWRIEEISVATAEVLDRWPAILKNLADIAETSKGKNAIEAAKLLHDLSVAPALAGKINPGAEEAVYLEMPKNFRPMDV